MTAMLSGFTDLLRGRQRRCDRVIVHVDAAFYNPRFAFHIERGGKTFHAEDDEMVIPGFSSVRSELEAFIKALERLIDLGMSGEPITVHVDDKNLADLLNRDRTKSSKCYDAHLAARSLMARFTDLTVQWMPREHNRAHRAAYRHRPRKMSPILTP